MPAYEAAELFWLIANSVMFRAVDNSGEKKLIVRHSSHKRGPREYKNLASVYRRSGAQFELVDPVENALAGAKAGAEIDRRLSGLSRLVARKK